MNVRKEVQEELTEEEDSMMVFKKLKSIISKPPRIGDAFDIKLDRERAVLRKRGCNLTIARPRGQASITWEGAIRFFPSEAWKHVNLRAILRIVCHETYHIAVGQLEGLRASEWLDVLTDDEKIYIGGREYQTDLFVREDDPESQPTIVPSERFWDGV